MAWRFTAALHIACCCFLLAAVHQCQARPAIQPVTQVFYSFMCSSGNVPQHMFRRFNGLVRDLSANPNVDVPPGIQLPQGNFPPGLTLVNWTSFFNITGNGPCPQQQVTAPAADRPSARPESEEPQAAVLATTEPPMTTAEDPTSPPAAASCMLVDSKARRLRALTDDYSFDYWSKDCVFTADPTMQDKDLPENFNPASFVACENSADCHISERKQEILRHIHGIDEVFTASKCGCGSTPACTRRSQVHRFYPDTPMETSVDIGECVGTCGLTDESCKPTRERTMNITGLSGSRCVKAIEECGCAGSCVFMPRREVYMELKLNMSSSPVTIYTAEKEIMTGTCIGSCQPPHAYSANRPRCAPVYASTRQEVFVGHHEKLMTVDVVTECQCV